MRGIEPPRVLGVALVVVGGLWLLRSLGVITAVPVGPVVLIAVGTFILVTALREQSTAVEVPMAPSRPTGGDGRSAGSAGWEEPGRSDGPLGGEAPTRVTTLGWSDPSHHTVQHLARDGATRARLVINHGAGTLRIHRGAPAGDVVGLGGDGTAEARSRRDGDLLNITVAPRGQVGGVVSRMKPVEWDIAIGEDIAVELDIRTGAARLDVDLTGLTVELIVVKAGASDIELVLPDMGRCAVAVHAGAADVRIRVPHGVAAAIRDRSALASITVDQHRFPRVPGGYRSPDFDTAEIRAEVELEGGVTAFAVR